MIFFRKKNVRYKLGIAINALDLNSKKTGSRVLEFTPRGSPWTKICVLVIPIQHLEILNKPFGLKVTIICHIISFNKGMSPLSVNILSQNRLNAIKKS